MKKNLLFLSLFCGLLGFSACDDDETPYTPDEYLEDPTGGNTATTMLGWTEAEKTVTFLNDAIAIPVNLEIVRTGTSNLDAVTTQFDVLTQEELNSYNTENGTAYTLLDAAHYTLPSETKVAGDVKRLKIMGMTIKPSVQEVGDLSLRDYVIPVRLSSAQCTINEDYGVLMVLVKAITPMFYLKESGVISESVIISGSEVEETYPLSAYLNVDNRWNGATKVQFESDEATLQSWVDAYNQTSGIASKLLPAANYKINGGNDLEFGDKSAQASFVISVSGKGEQKLEDGEYTLPIVLNSCSQQPTDGVFIADQKTVAYLRFSVSIPFFELKGDEEPVTVKIGTSATKQLTIGMNIPYQWENASTILFQTEGLQELADSYNAENGTAYELLDAAYYEFPTGVTFGTKNEKNETVNFNVTINTEDMPAEDKDYLLPVVITSQEQDVIEAGTYYLVMQARTRVFEPIELTGEMLSVPFETKSNWADLPINGLVDGLYYTNGDKNSHYWQSEWTFPNSVGCQNREQYYGSEYGAYFDVDLSTALQGVPQPEKLRITVWGTRDNQNPKQTVIYIQESEGGEWKVLQEYDSYLVGQPNKTLVHYPEGKETKTSGKERTDEYDLIAYSGVHALRFSFKSSQSSNDFTKSGTVGLDEIKIWRY